MVPDTSAVPIPLSVGSRDRLTMLIAFDADGPLIDFTAGLCARLQAEGYPYEPADIHHWDLRTSIEPSAMKAVERIMGEEGFCLSLPWVSGAKALLQSLRNDGHELICVTSPHHSKHWLAERNARLQEAFDRDDIMFVRGSRKSLIRADVLIEDHPGNATSWCESNKAGLAFLTDRPWNSVRATEWRCHPRMVRVEDGQVLGWVRSL